MPNALNNMPDFSTKFMNGAMNSKDWFFFLYGLYQGLAPENEAPVIVGASPFIYSATKKGSLIVSGGTVSAIEFSREGVTYYSTGQTSGMFSLNAQDRLRVTYTVLPTMTFVPS